MSLKFQACSAPVLSCFAKETFCKEVEECCSVEALLWKLMVGELVLNKYGEVDRLISIFIWNF